MTLTRLLIALALGALLPALGAADAVPGLDVTSAGAEWQSVNEGNVSMNSSSFGISDGEINGGAQDDAYDGFHGIEVDGSGYDNNGAGVFDFSGDTITGKIESLSGLDVWLQYYFDPNDAVVRVLVGMTNPSGSPISATITYGGNLGSDSDTVLLATASGDAIFDTSDRWAISHDDFDGPDPVLLHVLYGPGAPAVTTQTLQEIPANGNDDLEADFDVTVPANSTRYLLFFGGMHASFLESQTFAANFNSMAALQATSLLDGLCASELAGVLNWSFPAAASGLYVANRFGSGAQPVSNTQPSGDTRVGAYSAIAVGPQTLNSITATIQGTIVAADLNANGVKLWEDVNRDGALDGGDTLLDSTDFTGTTATLSAGSLAIADGAIRSFLITYDLAASSAGKQFGVSIVSATDFSAAGTVIPCGNLPFAGPIGQIFAQINTLPYFEQFGGPTLASNILTQTGAGTYPTATTAGITVGSTAGFGPSAIVFGPTSESFLHSPPNAARFLNPGFNSNIVCALDFYFDLSAFTAATDNLEFSFWHSDFGGFDDDEDNVFVSLDNGATWALSAHDLQPASNPASQVTVDLSAALVAATLNYTNQVVIRIQVREDFNSPMAFIEDVRLRELVDGVDVSFSASGSDFATATGVATAVGALDVTADVNNQDINSIAVSTLGTLADSGYASVELWQDDGDGSFDSGSDTMLSSQSVLSGGATFAGMPLINITSGNTERLFLVVTLAAGATASDTFGLSIANAADITLGGGGAVGSIQSFPLDSELGAAFAVAVLTTGNLPFVENFDSGTPTMVQAEFAAGTQYPMASSAGGTVTLSAPTPNDARVRRADSSVTAPFNGTHSVLFDYPNSDGTGAIDFHLDMSAFDANNDTLFLGFAWAHSDDETDDEENVFISVDGGATWLASLFYFDTGNAPSFSYLTEAINLSAALLSASSNYTNQVVIRFQGSDNASFSTDGLMIDDVRIGNGPIMQVTRGGTQILDGTTDSVPDVQTGTGGGVQYTISNTGDLALDITSVSISNAVNAQPIAVFPPANSTVPASGSEQFTVLFFTPANGTFSFDVVITTSLGTFSYTVSGTAVASLGSSGGGDGGGDDDSGCSTGTGTNLLVLLALLSIVGVAYRVRGSRA